jgi:hypothetical protein
MSTIHKAIIRSYNAGTHHATVQLTASIAQYLADLRVATNIPAADVVADRECTVLMLDPNNPTDALILSIQGAMPTGGGGGTTDHALLTHLAYADAAHTGFCSLATAQTLTAEKLIDQAVALRFGHASGPTLQGPATDNVLTLTGRLKIAPDSPASGIVLEIAPTGTPTGTSIKNLAVSNTLTALTAGTDYYGFYVVPNIAIPAASTTCDLFGLWFQGFVKAGGAGTVVPNLVGGLFRTGTFAYNGTITSARCLEADPFHQSYASALITTTWGLRINGPGYSCMQDVYGIQCTDFTAPTGFIRLLELGPSTPYLRVVGGAPAGANQTNLWLSEGAAPTTLRQVQWKLNSALVAGDRVMVLV